MQIANHTVGAPDRCFVIAEAGVNHNGSLETARALIDAACAAGADAVKFQTFRADALVSASAARATYQQQNDPAGGDTQRAMLAALELDADAHRDLFAYGAEREIIVLSTPFDEASAAMLDAFDVPAFKISSGDLTHLPLLRAIAAYGRPMILSTGMATIEDVTAAVLAVREVAAVPMAVLHCVSCYPTAPADANLRAIDTLRTHLQAMDPAIAIGWSDHTDGLAIALAAVARGASILEKHLTLDRSMPGPDHAASLEPDVFTRLVAYVREIEVALGSGVKEPCAAEADVARVARRSLIARHDLAPGAALESKDITIQRPGTGLAPAEYERVIGRIVARRVAAGAPIVAEDLA